MATRAASFTSTLSPAGPLPNRDQYNLVITGTTRGSFGFELENLVPPDALLGSCTAPLYLEDALNDTIDFFESVRGTDEELAESVIGADDRVVRGISDFLKLLAENDAVCGIEFGQRSFYFRDTAEVKRGVQRLHKDNMRERDETIQGVFLGVLPCKRQFEFRRTSDDSVLYGRIDTDVPDPVRINALVNQSVSINIHVTQVGSSKPKYRLREFSVSKEDETAETTCEGEPSEIN